MTTLKSLFVYPIIGLSCFKTGRSIEECKQWQYFRESEVKMRLAQFTQEDQSRGSSSGPAIGGGQSAAGVGNALSGVGTTLPSPISALQSPVASPSSGLSGASAGATSSALTAGCQGVGVLMATSACASGATQSSNQNSAANSTASVPSLLNPEAPGAGSVGVQSGVPAGLGLSQSQSYNPP